MLTHYAGAPLRALIIFGVIALGSVAGAQGDKPTGTPTTKDGQTATKPDTKPAATGTTTTPTKPAAPSVTMQLRREVAGNFLCRFVTATDDSAPLVPLPAAVGTDNVVAVPVPSTVNPKSGQMEVVDPDHSRVARLPIGTSGVTALNDSSFTLVQTVLVPVLVKGKGGLTAASVTMVSDDKSYKKSVTLTPADAGTARFVNVPLKKPITVTVTEGNNAPVSATQTLTVPTSAEGYRWSPAFEVNWADAHAVPLPTAPATTATGTGTAAPPLATPSNSSAPSTPNNSENPLSGIVSTAVSLLFLGGVGFGLYWAYQNGHIKTLFDKLGIQTQPLTAGGPQPSPFEKPKTPIVPITEGTADPLSGSSHFAGGGAFAAAPVATAGPRLVGTMGTYAGTIFPLNLPSMDIGRDAANPMAMPQDTNASRKHATFQTLGGQITVTDNGSSNGTYVNGVRIPAQTPHPLTPGDEVQVGMTRFRFEG